MIQVVLRDNNDIINLISETKVPIRGKTSENQYFHTPLELLLSTLGLCIGGEINSYCRLNNLKVQIFESIFIDYDFNKFIIKIQKPEDLEQEHIDLLSKQLIVCNISRVLKNQVEVEWFNNTIKTETLIIQKKGCCGS